MPSEEGEREKGERKEERETEKDTQREEVALSHLKAISQQLRAEQRAAAGVVKQIKLII